MTFHKTQTGKKRKKGEKKKKRRERKKKQRQNNKQKKINQTNKQKEFFFLTHPCMGEREEENKTRTLPAQTDNAVGVRDWPTGR